MIHICPISPGSHEYSKSGGLSRNQGKAWVHRDPVSTSLRTIHNFADLRDYNSILLCGAVRHVVYNSHIFDSDCQWNSIESGS